MVTYQNAFRPGLHVHVKGRISLLPAGMGLEASGKGCFQPLIPCLRVNVPMGCQITVHWFFPSYLPIESSLRFLDVVQRFFYDSLNCWDVSCWLIFWKRRGKDRITHEGSGWFFTALSILYLLMPPSNRSSCFALFRPVTVFSTSSFLFSWSVIMAWWACVIPLL